MQDYHQDVRDIIDHEFTIYPTRRVDGKTHKGRAAARTGFTDDSMVVVPVREYTGVTIHVITAGNHAYAGVAIQMSGDQFNRKIGRNIAKGRAEKCAAILRTNGDSAMAGMGRIKVVIGDFNYGPIVAKKDIDRLRNYGVSSIPGVEIL